MNTSTHAAAAQVSAPVSSTNSRHNELVALAANAINQGLLSDQQIARDIARTKWLTDDEAVAIVRTAHERIAQAAQHQQRVLDEREPTTDTGNARRFAKRNGSRVRYVFEQRQWLVWDGKRWAADTTGAVERFAKQTAKAIHSEAAAAEDGTKLGKWAVASESDAKLKAMLSGACSEPEIVTTPDKLDADPWSLNVENGTVDLRTGELRPHDPAEMHSKVAGAALHPQATAPSWGRFLEEVLPNAEVRRFVQKLAGYSLTGEVGEHVLPFAFGSGANGKSVFFSVIRKVLGDYAAEAAPELLVARYGDRGVPTDIIDLRGFRFVTTSEVEGGKRMDSALMKRITGEDTLKARRMHRDFESFRNVTHLWMAANDRPQVDGLDEAIWRRVRLIPFEVVIPQEKRNPYLIAKLLEERDGILGWLVEGCLAYAREGLDAPEAVKLATADYRADSNPLAEWFAECCEADGEAFVPAAELHACYKEWCARSRYRGKPIASNSPKWRAGLESLGLRADKTYIAGKQARGWRGVRLGAQSASCGLDI